MINRPSPFKGLKIRIPITIPIKGRGFINHGFGLEMSKRLFLRASRCSDLKSSADCEDSKQFSADSKLCPLDGRG